MADIAMLVAEEYERRIKGARKTGDGSGAPVMEKGLVSVLGQAPSQVISSIKWFQDYEGAFNPASPMAVAALESSFSA